MKLTKIRDNLYKFPFPLKVSISYCEYTLQPLMSDSQFHIFIRNRESLRKSVLRDITLLKHLNVLNKVSIQFIYGFTNANYSSHKKAIDYKVAYLCGWHYLLQAIKVHMPDDQVEKFTQMQKQIVVLIHFLNSKLAK